jgi:signal transduction histidine kinase
VIRSLRNKFALSHIIPILLLLPILTLYLLYSLDTFFTQALLQQLGYQAQLLQNELQRDPGILANHQTAQEFVSELHHVTDARIVILAPDSTILASSEATEINPVGTRFSDAAVTQALAGQAAQGVGPGLVAEVAYVVLPIANQGKIIGALRLSYKVADFRSYFSQLQWLVLGGTGVTIVLGLGLGLSLATTITRPLRALSESAQEIAKGNYAARTEVHSRDELGILELNFNQMAARLQELEQARKRQLAAIRHELARPLTGMRAAVEILRDGTDMDAEAREPLLDGVLEELGRLQRMLDTLQYEEKRTLRPLSLQRAVISLDRMIHATLANYEALAAQAQITLSAELPSTPLYVYADEDRLIQVLTNLLDNAFKFTWRGGRIIVTAAVKENNVAVSVEDTGTGIAPDELPYVFQEFYSGSKTHLPEQRGMGLGLAICREIVTAHGGTIQAESTPGRGTRFTFYLPIRDS